MAIVALMDFETREGKLEEFLGILETALVDTRAYDGCLGIKTCVYQDQQKICLVEEWENLEKQQAYFAWRQETGLLEAIDPYVSNVTGTFLDLKQTF